MFIISTLLRQITYRCVHVKKTSYFVEKIIHLRYSMAETEFTIGTHSGTFHCDEVLSCFMLLKLHPVGKIIRTRDYSTLDKCDIVVDVGGIYDHDKRRYDHHQRNFHFTMHDFLPDKPWNIKLSSAGLIYYHYGLDVLKQILNNEDDSLLKFVFNYVYLNFIQEIDAIDNGVPIAENPLYSINTGLSARVGKLNKPWNINNDEYDEDKSFNNAMEMVGKEFLEAIEFASTVNFPARQSILNAVENRFNIHSSGEIIELTQYFPWEVHFFDIESEMKLIPTIKYVIFKTDNDYRVRCVPVEYKSFICRKFLPEEWRGLSDHKLSDVTGIENSIFVHHTGFIGGTKTREGALAMTIKALLN